MSFFRRLFGGRQHNPSLAIRGGTVSVEVVDSSAAQRLWDKRRQEFAQSGQWPLIVGAQAQFETLRVADDLLDGQTPSQVIAAAAQIDARQFLADRLESYLNDVEEDFEDDEEHAAMYARPDPSSLNTDLAGANGFASPYPYGESGRTKAGIVTLPCENPWEVCAVRPFGNWNEVPDDATVTAVIKSWYERFGALPACLTQDVMEFWLDRPVTDPQAACDLALEHYAFCPDAVDQGAESFQALAQQILNAHVWSFWWD